MQKRIIVTLLVLVLAFSLLAGCGGGTTTTTGAAQTDAPDSTSKATEAGTTKAPGTDETGAEPSGEAIIIGGLAPLTGNVSVYGIAVNNGVELAIEEINKAGGVLGRPIKYIVYDEKGDAIEAVNAYNRLKNEDKIVALIGDVTSTPTIAVAQRAAADNMPMITASGTSDEITKQGKNVFRTCFTDPYQGKIMAQFAAGNLKFQKAAVLYDVSDNYAKGLSDAFIEEAKNQGIEVVATETYNQGDGDFKTQLTKIAAAKPETLYVPNYYGDNILIVRQAKQVGLDVPFLGGDGWDGILDPDVIGSADKDADNAYFSNHYSEQDPNEKLQNFLKNYRDKYKIEPVSFAALGYDSAHMMLQAIKEANSTDSQAIIDAMKNIEFEGITGNIKFDENNNPIKSVSVIKIEDGKYTLFTKLEAK